MDQDAGLLAAMEDLFSETDYMVIAAFEVFKRPRGGDATGAQLLKALGSKAYTKDSPKSRVLCFTVKRSSDRGFRGQICVCKPTDSAKRYQLRRTYLIKYLIDLAAVPQRYEHREQRLVQLHILPHSTIPETKWEFALANSEELMFFLSVLFQLLRQQDCKLPVTSGMSVEVVDSWWLQNRDLCSRRLSNFALEVLTPGAMAARAGGGVVLVSAKEEKDLEELLDMFAMGIGDVQDFNARLNDEFSALEAANVHAILESAPLVEMVLYQLKKAQSTLEDLDESLKVFDFKLRHMRQDIAAIEACNNVLELQSRNNAVLLATLRQLLNDLKLDEKVEATLNSPAFTTDKLDVTVRAAWALHGKLQRLDASSGAAISPHLLGMRVARDERHSLEHTAKGFASKALTHLRTLLGAASDEMMADAAKASGASKAVPPSHAKFRSLLQRHADLIRVLAALLPGGVAKLQSSYCTTMNAVLRRELRNCSSELRKAVQADTNSSTQDFNIAKERSGSMGRRAQGAYGGGGADDDSTSDAMSERSGISEALSSVSALNRSGSNAALGFRRMATRTKQLFTEGPGGSGASVVGGSGGLGLGLVGGGGSSAASLSDAYKGMLDGFLPFLLEEAEFAAGLFMWYRPRGSTPQAPEVGNGAGDVRAGTPGSDSGADLSLTEEGRELLDVLLAGVEADFQVLVDLTGRGQAVMAVPMLSSTSRWLSALRSRNIAGVLLRALAACHERLRAHFATFLQQQIAAVDKFETTSGFLTRTSGVKGAHVLPFVSNFALLAHNLEVLLREAGEGTAASDRAAAITAAATPRGNPSPVEFDLPKSSTDYSVRSEVDLVYQQLVSHVFSAVERLAATDAKHGKRLRLENYAFFCESVRPLAAHVAALQPFRQAAEQKQEAAMVSYVQQSLEHGRLWKILEFSEKVDKLLEVVTAGEVSFQMNFSANDVRSLIRSTMESTDKKLAGMYERVRRHLGGSSLAVKVWGRIKDALMRRYTRLEQQIAQCYPSVPLRPTPSELREVIKNVGGS